MIVTRVGSVESMTTKFESSDRVCLYLPCFSSSILLHSVCLALLIRPILV